MNDSIEQLCNMTMNWKIKQRRQNCVYELCSNKRKGNIKAKPQNKMNNEWIRTLMLLELIPFTVI
jgi:hypothetical protein